MGRTFITHGIIATYIQKFGKRVLQDFGVERGIIPKWRLENRACVFGLDLSGSRQDPVTVSSEDGNEPSK